MQKFLEMFEGQFQLKNNLERVIYLLERYYL